MKRSVIFAAATAVATAVTAAAFAAGPIVTPFPAAKGGQVFVAAETVTSSGAAASWFAPGSTVVFRAYAVDGKTKKVLAAKDVKYFYVAIPNEPSVKLKYDAKAPGATPSLAWTGTWVVPASYPAGTVPFKVLVKTNAKRYGYFVQLPVAPSQLTISATPPALPAGAPPPTAGPSGTSDVSLYVDGVNGTGPKGAAPRPIGCTQTNVYKRGEQLVLRSWGIDLGSGDVLSSDNIDTAAAAIPGQPALALNWGAHGTTANKVWYWTAPWAIPTDYPLGDATIKVTFKTDGGKVGTYDYAITIIP